jgi:hypothetical protein
MLTQESYSYTTERKMASYYIAVRFHFDNLTHWLQGGNAVEKAIVVRSLGSFDLKLSNGGQTMTIRSIAYFITGTPYKVNVKQQAYTDVTEVWNLSNDGKSIAVLAKAKSNIWKEERSWKTVFDKIN